MPSDPLDPAYFSPDIREFIALLHHYGVRYVVVGGEAVIYYGHARLTGDIDFFYDRSAPNAAALFQALKAFWSGNIPALTKSDELQEPGVIIQFGVPPNRIDLLNQIDGVEFAEAWRTRVTVTLKTPDGEVELHYLGVALLIQNKQQVARPKDLEDLEFLKKLRTPE